MIGGILLLSNLYLLKLGYFGDMELIVVISKENLQLYKSRNNSKDSSNNN